MKPCRVTIASGQTAVFPAGTLLADALLDMGVVLDTACGGRGTCGRCRVRVAGDLSAPLTDELERITPGERLACRAALTGDVTVQPDFRPEAPETAPLDGPCRAAVDIGTTTVKVKLDDGARSLEKTCLNPQRRYGHDVIARIRAARDPQVARRMQTLIHQALQTAVGDNDASRIAVCANTTMLYLLLGLDPAPLGRAPFTAPLRDFASRSLLGADAVILPPADAFIGADLVGALTLLHDRGPGTFFVDLGTNGEMFVINPSGRILATSCAMGPALEGMNISCGMTATVGAVSHVGDDLECTVIGGGQPLGLSGTGLVDLMTRLLSRDIISANGRLCRDRKLPPPLRLQENNLHVFDALTLTQGDIRNFQLARAASLSGAAMLLEHAGLSPDDIKQVHVAGAFGQNLDLENFKRLKFLPPFAGATWHLAGNTSLRAAECALGDRDFYRRSRALRDRVETINLSTCATFQRRFMQALNF